MKRALHLWNEDSDIKDIKGSDYDLKRKLKNEERKNDIVTMMFDWVLTYVSRPLLHKDTIKMLEKLRKRGKKVAIFSNGSSKRVMREFRLLGITGYFDVIVSARDLHALKPNPTGLKLILKMTKTKAEKCVYIGDMVDDVLAAKLIKVDSCAVADGFDSYHKLKSIKPDYLSEA